eukprot:297023_1
MNTINYFIVLSITLFISIQKATQFTLSDVKLPQKMRQHFAGIYNNTFTVLGGLDSAGSGITESQSTMIHTSLNANKWNTNNNTTMPLGIYRMSADGGGFDIRINEKLYIINPSLSGGTATSYHEILIYNLKTNQFTVSVKSTYRAQGACSVYNNKNNIIYTIGSYTNGYKQHTQRFSVLNNTWMTPGGNTVHAKNQAGCSLDVTNDYIFYFGGSAPSSLNEIEKYTVADNEWILLSSTLSSPRYRLNCRLLPINKNIFCIGGWNGIALNTVDVFNTTSQSVINTIYLNVGRYSNAVTLWNDGLCLIVSGGYDGSFNLDSIETFGDCTAPTQSPTTAPTEASDVFLPQKMREHFAVIYNDTFTVFGGYDSTGDYIKPFQSTAIFITLNAKQWTVTNVTLPLNISGISMEGNSAVQINAKLYIINPQTFGGTGTVFHQLFIYNLITKQFTVSAIPTYLSEGSCSLYNDNNNIIYTIGGYSNGGLRYTQRFNVLSNKWIIPGGNTVNAKWHSGCSLDATNDHIYYFGGYKSGTGQTNEIEKYTMLDNAWTLLSSTLTVPRHNFRCRLLSTDNYIYCIGGGSSGGVLNMVDVFQPTTESIINTIALNKPRYFGLSTTLWNDNKCLIIVGGWDGTTYFDLIETLGDCTAPTSSPSKNPTSAPSVSPSKAPTIIPTLAPSKSPSYAPFISPTSIPTLAPSTAPTWVPSISPSTSPTIPPTLTPTSSCFDYNNEFSNDGDVQFDFLDQYISLNQP